MDEEKIAQGTYDFRVMREKGYRYVDKTALLHPLVTRDGDGFFFISRPRRFGKSLMLSTLECLFRGERELFKGLAIDKMDYDWESYPVLHFNFGTMDVTTFEAFQTGFVARVQEVIEDAKVPYNPTFAPNDNFSRAIKALARERGKPVVILIDEYDAPVGAALNDIEKATAIRAKLSAFYGEIKNNVGAIRFMMMTGVTKFTQLSVFSARFSPRPPRFWATPRRSWRLTSASRCTATRRSWAFPTKIIAANSVGGTTAIASRRGARPRFTTLWPSAVHCRGRANSSSPHGRRPATPPHS